MQPGLDCQFELGAHTVGARDQYRLPVTIKRQFEQGAKATQSGQYARSPGFRDGRFDALDQLAAGIDIHPGIPVAQGV